MPAPELILRPASADELLRVIPHDWFLSYRNNGSKDTQELGHDIYGQQNLLIAHLLATCPPIVATFAGVPDEVVGWVCRDVSKPLTHFVYVKFDYRRTGVAAVLTQGTRQHSHKTRAGELLARKLGSTFNPYSLYRGVP